MKQDRVSMAFYDRRSTDEPLTRTPVFTGSKVKQWFQRQAWDLLIRWGCMERSFSYHRIEFSKRDFCNNLNQHFDIFARTQNKAPRQILIGQETFDDVMSQPHLGPGFRTNWEFEIEVKQASQSQYPGDRPQIHYQGIPVTVVPYMQGTLVL